MPKPHPHWVYIVYPTYILEYEAKPKRHQEYTKKTPHLLNENRKKLLLGVKINFIYSNDNQCARHDVNNIFSFRLSCAIVVFPSRLILAEW
jgi:hypothetical protein